MLISAMLMGTLSGCGGRSKDDEKDTSKTDKMTKKYENYFEIEQERQKEYFYKLEIFINLAKKISDNVIIYITPHSINAVKHNNENDIEILNKFSQDIIKFCENKGIKCIDIDITEDDYYIDIVHFNSKGHEKMSEIMYKILN